MSVIETFAAWTERATGVPSPYVLAALVALWGLVFFYLLPCAGECG
jgi:hypothetical protein